MANKNKSLEIQNNIMKALHISSLSYTNYIYQCFAKWCYIQGQKQSILMIHLLENKHLQEWYKTQWQHVVESPFYYEYNIEEIIHAKVAAPEAYKNLMDCYPEAIEGYFPGTLLTMIKNPKPNESKRTRNSQ